MLVGTYLLQNYVFNICTRYLPKYVLEYVLEATLIVLKAAHIYYYYVLICLGKYEISLAMHYLKSQYKYLSMQQMNLLKNSLLNFFHNIFLVLLRNFAYFLFRIQLQQQSLFETGLLLQSCQLENEEKGSRNYAFCSGARLEMGKQEKNLLHLAKIYK